MPQPIYLEQVPQGSGIQLGTGVYFLFASGNPNSRTDKLVTAQSVTGVDSVSIGSLYIDRTAGVLYIKTGAISTSAPSGVWSALQTA